MGNGNNKVKHTEAEISNDEQEAFAKTVPAHLVIGELSNPSHGSARHTLGQFVRVMRDRAGCLFHVVSPVLTR